jgi:hypothetical protein
MALDPTELAQIVSAVLTAMRTATPQAAASKPVFLPKGSRAPAASLAEKDAALINALHRKGFKDVQLMDRSDRSRPFNVKPYKLWLAEGRIVRKGQKATHGMFHLHQTDLLPVAKGKPSISSEQKALFAKAKASLKAKQAKAQPTTV